MRHRVSPRIRRAVLAITIVVLTPHQLRPQPALSAPKQLSRIRQDEPVYSPDGRSILFLSDDSGIANLYVMDTTGGRIRRLTTNPTEDDSGVWSPDGTRVAYNSTDHRTEISEIFIVNADGTGNRQVTHDRAFNLHPAWSPDGKRLMYTSTRDSRTPLANQDIWETYIINADGTGERRLTTDNGVNTYASWSADGSKILFRKKIDSLKNSEVFVMDSDATHLKNLTNDPGYDRFPLWSPDGSKIVFESNRAGHSQLFLMNADGSNVRVLVDGPGQLSAPRFSPDGRRVIYPRDLNGNITIFTVPVP